MNEPTDPKPEYQLEGADFELIKQIDFRLNNVMTALLGSLELALEPDGTFWPDAKVAALKMFLFERCQAVSEHKANMAASDNADIRQLGQGLDVVVQQLMSIAGALESYTRNHDVRWLQDSVSDSYDRMKPQVDAVGRNRAYGAYKARIMKDNLEASRNHFEYEDSHSGK